MVSKNISSYDTHRHFGPTEAVGCLDEGDEYLSVEAQNADISL